MLTAHGEGERFVATTTPPERLRALSKRRALRCRACEGDVIFRRGELRIPHFAHRTGAECPLSQDPDCAPEGPTHLALKAALHAWVVATMPNATAELEARIVETNQRADLLVTLPSARVAFEVQCAELSGRAWRERHDGYRRAGVRDLWLLAGRPPEAVTLPGSARYKTPTSFRLQLRDLAATILHETGELLFAWEAPGPAGLLRFLDRAQRGTTLGALVPASPGTASPRRGDAKASRCPGKTSDAESEPFVRRALTINEHRLCSGPLKAAHLTLEAPPRLVIDASHDALHAEVSRDEAACLSADRSQRAPRRTPPPPARAARPPPRSR